MKEKGCIRRKEGRKYRKTKNEKMERRKEGWKNKIKQWNKKRKIRNIYKQ